MSLLVTVDDVGLCKEINDAAWQLYDAGVVNSVSLMVNSDFFDETIKEVKKRPGLKVCVHLNLTDGRPVSSALSVPSLLNKKNQFIGGTHYGVLTNLVLGKFKTAEVELEWKNQVEKVIKADIPVYGLNGHGHLHLMPALHNIVISLVKEFKIPYVRLVLSRESLKESLFRILSCGFLKKANLAGVAVTYPERILGLNDHGHLKKDKIMAELQKAEKGFSELISHPAKNRNKYHNAWHYEGAEELAALLNSAVKNTVKQINQCS